MHILWCAAAAAAGVVGCCRLLLLPGIIKLRSCLIAALIAPCFVVVKIDLTPSPWLPIAIVIGPSSSLKCQFVVVVAVAGWLAGWLDGIVVGVAATSHAVGLAY